MVRRRTARGLKFDEGTVRVNVSGLLVENQSLLALDDDSHVPVLLNPSVPKDAFERSGFPARGGLLSRLVLSSADRWNPSTRRRTISLIPVSERLSLSRRTEYAPLLINRCKEMVS